MRSIVVVTIFRSVLRSLMIAGMLLFSSLGDAHHSFAMFDRTRTLTLDGTVRNFSWTNPHAYFWLFVTNAQGNQDIWAIEIAAGPVALEQSGWTKQTLNPGDKVAVEINPLKDGRTGGTLKRLHLADGRILDQDIDPPPGALHEGGK